jgi:hypothetical protein
MWSLNEVEKLKINININSFSIIKEKKENQEI